MARVGGSGYTGLSLGMFLLPDDTPLDNSATVNSAGDALSAPGAP